MTYSVEPDRPGGFARLWRESAYRIRGKKGLGDVYLQLCARAAISEYPFKSPEYKRNYTVKENEFYASLRELCRLCSKDPKTLKNILKSLTDMGLIEFKQFEDCICFSIIQDPAIGTCVSNPTGVPVGEIPQDVCVKSHRRVGEIPLTCTSNPTPKDKKKRRKKKGEEKSEVPPQPKISTSIESGNQDPIEKPVKALPEDVIALGDEWYDWTSSKLTKNHYKRFEFHRAVDEIKDRLKGDMAKARQVFEFLKTDSKMGNVFINPCWHAKNFGGISILDDILLKLSEKKPEPLKVKTIEECDREIMEQAKQLSLIMGGRKNGVK